MNPTIIIDAGHGGFDNGASYNGRKEKDDNLRLALAVGERLEQMGFPVVYTRTTDVYQRPIDKARMANESGGDYFVSFHRNSSENANQYNGIQTLVYNATGVPYEMATNINEELVKLGFKDLGIPERKDLIVLKHTKMPAVLIEAGFINSDIDNRIFDENFEGVVNAIATGIANTVGTAEKKYGVQVGLYRRFENAQFTLNELLAQGYDAQIREWKEYYAVVVGQAATLEEARELEQELQQKGYNTLIVNL